MDKNEIKNVGLDIAQSVLDSARDNKNIGQIAEDVAETALVAMEPVQKNNIFSAVLSIAGFLFTLLRKRK